MCVCVLSKDCDQCDSESVSVTCLFFSLSHIFSLWSRSMSLSPMCFGEIRGSTKKVWKKKVKREWWTGGGKKEIDWDRWQGREHRTWRLKTSWGGGDRKWVREGVDQAENFNLSAETRLDLMHTHGNVFHSMAKKKQKEKNVPGKTPGAKYLLPKLTFPTSSLLSSPLLRTQSKKPLSPLTLPFAALPIVLSGLLSLFPLFFASSIKLSLFSLSFCPILTVEPLCKKTHAQLGLYGTVAGRTLWRQLAPQRKWIILQMWGLHLFPIWHVSGISLKPGQTISLHCYKENGTWKSWDLLHSLDLQLWGKKKHITNLYHFSGILGA